MSRGLWLCLGTGSCSLLLGACGIEESAKGMKGPEEKIGKPLTETNNPPISLENILAFDETRFNESFAYTCLFLNNNLRNLSPDDILQLLDKFKTLSEQSNFQTKLNASDMIFQILQKININNDALLTSIFIH